MTPENFCYFLQGIFEIGGLKTLNEQQVQQVKDHLALVFNKVTPDYFPPACGDVDAYDSFVPGTVVTIEEAKAKMGKSQSTSANTKVCLDAKVEPGGANSTPGGLGGCGSGDSIDLGKPTAADMEELLKSTGEFISKQHPMSMGSYYHGKKRYC